MSNDKPGYVCKVGINDSIPTPRSQDELETVVDTSGIEEIKNILSYVGEDPNREGLEETPKRVMKAWKEMLSGYHDEEDEKILKVFEDGGEGYDEMIVVSGIKVQSFCEHHMIPFFGTATVAYIPNGKIVGLSKINRIVNKYMRRLQVQERLTVQIADALDKALSPLGVAVKIQCTHLCVVYRGIKDVNSVTTTTSLRGLFKEDIKARNEFLSVS